MAVSILLHFRIITYKSTRARSALRSIRYRSASLEERPSASRSGAAHLDERHFVAIGAGLRPFRSASL